MTPQTDSAIRDWLLQRLDVVRSEHVEEALFVDAELADRIDEIHRDLLDAAVAGQLDAAETAQVSGSTRANARGRERWHVARALVQYRKNRRVRPDRRWMIGSAAMAACLILSALAILKPWRPTDAVTPTISLRATAQRAIERATVALPPNDGQVRLQAEIGEAGGDHFTLRIAERGQTLFEANGLAVRHVGRIRFVEATVPTANLGPGERHVSVAKEGTADVATWDVTVTAQ